MNIDLTLPDDAPFSAEQREWLNAFLAKKLADAQPPQGRKITILWGSQTGNAENLSKKTGKALAKVGFSPEIVDMAAYDKEKLATEEDLLIITSTYGDGDPPDNAMDLHAWLMSDAAPKLEGLKYSVLALGDTDYPDFCICGIEFDERLEALGAERMM